MAIPARADVPAPAALGRRLVGALPALRATLGASVVLGLVSSAAVALQAVALAHLLASAMPGSSAAGRGLDLLLLGAGAGARAASALLGEVVARVGAAASKAELRARLLSGALVAASRGEGTPGSLAALAGRGLDALDVYLGRCLADLVLAALAPLALVVVVGALDWVSALVLLVALGLFPVFGALVGRASADLARRRWRQVEALGRQVHDVFGGLVVLRALGRARAQRERIARASAALMGASLATLRVAFLSALVLDTLASVSVALVAVPLGLRLLGASVSLPAALAVLIVAPEVFVPLRRASAEFHESTEGLAAAARVLTALAPTGGDAGARSGAGAPARGGSLAPDPARVTVALRDVTVTVAGHREPVLSGASLEIAAGETVALVGANGAGKSTLAALLLGFVAPSAGALVAGDTDLAEVDPDAWRRRLAYLPEHPTLLAASLADNLRLGAPGASDDELRDALALVGAAEWCAHLPDGLATPLGDGGRPTSAGERQRVALARVVLRRASLVVLDEPTVHLDRAAEARAVAGLAHALVGRSALVITHRSAPLALATRVLALEGGRLVPAGAAALPGVSRVPA